MADAYMFPLLVLLEENNIPGLKMKLLEYFQSWLSNGGDCEVYYKNGSRTAMLRFRREEDQKNVLSNTVHQICLDKGVLKMMVQLPSEEKTTQEDFSHKGSKYSNVPVTNQQSAADKHRLDRIQAEMKFKDEPCSTSAVLENIPESMNKEFLEMLVENILKNLNSPTASMYSLELIPDISCAVVTFQNDKDNTDFIARWPQNRMFRKISVRPLEVTEQVVVEGVSNYNIDIVILYFENEGGEVEDVNVNEAEQSAVITFKNHQAVSKVMKKKHQINREEVKVYPFYKSLGVALYGKDQPSPKLPAAVSEPNDNADPKNLTDNKVAVETVRRDLAKHFCNVTPDQSTVHLSPTSSLLKEKALFKEQADTVKSAFVQALSKFKPMKFPLEPEVWKKPEEKIKQTFENENVAVVPDKASRGISVAGLQKPLLEIFEKTQKKMWREKSSKTQQYKVLPSIFNVLSQDGLLDKLLQVHPELKVSYDKQKTALKVTGFVEEINDTTRVLREAIIGLKRQHLEVDPYLFDMLRCENQEELTEALLTAHSINAALEISPQRVQLVAVSDKDLINAQDHLKQLLISKDINVEDSEVLKKPEWLQLVSQLENASSKSSSRIRIYSTHQQVVVSGHKDGVVKVSSELGDFLTENAHIEEIVAVESNVIIEYLESQTHWLELLEDEVAVSYAKQAIILSGPRAAVKNSKFIVEDVVGSVFFDCFKVTKPGVKKFFKDKESMYMTSIKTETGCFVRLVDDAGDEQDGFAFAQVQKPVYQIQTADGVEIAVSKADMCSYPVDAVVNSSNEDLKMSGSLSAALLKAAGPQLQNECDKIIKMEGKLRVGECVITDACGQLCCKKVIHAVGPGFDQTIPQVVEDQLKKTIRGSLELAEDEGCISVALPAISRNRGFSPNQCSMTIVKAVKEYCDEMYEDSTLKKIHLVDNDDSVVVAMESAVKKVFGNKLILSQLIPTLKAVKRPLKRVASVPSLCRVKTTEGLEIVLKTGNIEAAKTDVIVNTVFGDLALNHGAVSTAILNVAGPELQQLLTDQKPNGNPGEIIVTDSCKLKSKQVFHVVALKWDKGQGAAEKILGGIFKNCLDIAEMNHWGSISFPAIGTGKLGFPKDLVASLMLDTISDFSSQRQPKHLKEVSIIIYPKDTQTIKEFSDKFMQKFPNISAGPFSKVVSGSGVHETKMGNVTVQVASGDITKETTDVIVNSSNETFSLKSGVSKAILDEAGGDVEEECQHLGSQPNQGMIMTQPGNLKSKKILHLVGQTDPVKINTVVKEALQMCVKNSHTSVSFPAIGTGQGNVQAIQVADAMLDAVIDVLRQNPASALTLIRIVIFQQPMLKDFYNSMQQREASDPEVKVGFWQSVSQKVKSFFIPDQKEDFAIKAVKVDSVCFHICGDSRAQVDAAIKKINNLIDDEQKRIEITDNAILNLSPADHQQIADMQKKMGVSIRTEIKNGQASIIIEGLHKDVLNAKAEIDMLRNVRDEQEMKKKVEFTSTVADWQYQQHGLQFQSFDSVTNYQLEQALENNLLNLRVIAQGQVYTVTMPKGPATDSMGNVLQIRRIDKLKDDIPDYWETMPPGTTCLSFPVQPGTSESAKVLNLFHATCNRPITKIERIQNPALWKSLQIKKQELEVRNGHEDNEKQLFHGTSEPTVPIINEHGFNRSYAGLNAAYFGKGSYFAVNASYSAQDTYSKPNPNGEKFMYLCRVLTGDFTQGRPDIIAPPIKGGTSTHMFDSVVNDVSNPCMYVIFHDTQAYPEYLITFM